MVLVAIVAFLCNLLAAQQQQAPVDVPPELTLNKAKALTAKFKFDSALFLLEPLMTQLEQSDLKDSPLGLRTQLLMSSCWKHKNRKELSMSMLQEVKDKSQKTQQWEVFVRACLSLDYMHSYQSRKEEIWAMTAPAHTETIREQVKTNLALAKATIIHEQLDTLYPDYAVALAAWHLDFGYKDSLKHYTRLAMEAVKEVDHPRLLATVYNLEFLLLAETDYQEALARLSKATDIYRQLNDNVALSVNWYRASSTYKDRDFKKSLRYNDSTIHYYYQAIGEGREETSILSSAYHSRSNIYSDLNQLDSTIHYARRGYSEEMRWIKQQEKLSIAEAAEKYNANKQKLQLKEKAQELAYEQQRTTGLILLAGLSLFFASFVIFTYSKLRKSNRTTKSQAQKLRETNEKLETALESELVLRAEIHHRVKNNLQIISSLLQSQSESAKDPRVTRIMSEAQERIYSMSLIHQNLYQSDDLNRVSIKSYLQELITNIQRSHTETAATIDLELKVEDEHLDIDAAIPLGLILNELITNAYKYAFPNDKTGTIIVELSKKAKLFQLRVSDDGVGFPNDYDFSESDSLGLRLVKGLVRQLEGKIFWQEGVPGSSVAIEF